MERQINTPEEIARHPDVEASVKDILDAADLAERTSRVAQLVTKAIELSNTPKEVELKTELTPEEVAETLATLKARFNTNMHLHPELTWPQVQSALESNEEALLKLYIIESEGHEPDVFFHDDRNMYIGTCSAEPPKSTINCVYNQTAADKLLHFNPKEFDGIAVEDARKMGLKIFTKNLYKRLQIDSQYSLDKVTSTWLSTTGSLAFEEDVRLVGCSYLTNTKRRKLIFYDTPAREYHYYLGWRGYFKVPFVPTQK